MSTSIPDVDDAIPDDDGIPGADLVEAGLADLEAGRETIEAMLVSSAAERFRELGRPVPERWRQDLGNRLYAAIEASGPDRGT